MRSPGDELPSAVRSVCEALHTLTNAGSIDAEKKLQQAEERNKGTRAGGEEDR